MKIFKNFIKIVGYAFFGVFRGFGGGAAAGPIGVWRFRG